MADRDEFCMDVESWARALNALGGESGGGGNEPEDDGVELIYQYDWWSNSRGDNYNFVHSDSVFQPAVDDYNQYAGPYVPNDTGWGFHVEACMTGGLNTPPYSEFTEGMINDNYYGYLHLPPVWVTAYDSPSGAPLLEPGYLNRVMHVVEIREDANTYLLGGSLLFPWENAYSTGNTSTRGSFLTYEALDLAADNELDTLVGDDFPQRISPQVSFNYVDINNDHTVWLVHDATIDNSIYGALASTRTESPSYSAETSLLLQHITYDDNYQLIEIPNYAHTAMYDNNDDTLYPTPGLVTVDKTVYMFAEDIPSSINMTTGELASAPGRGVVLSYDRSTDDWTEVERPLYNTAYPGYMLTETVPVTTRRSLPGARVGSDETVVLRDDGAAYFTDPFTRVPHPAYFRVANNTLYVVDTPYIGEVSGSLPDGYDAPRIRAIDLTTRQLRWHKDGPVTTTDPTITTPAEWGLSSLSTAELGTVQITNQLAVLPNGDAIISMIYQKGGFNVSDDTRSFGFIRFHRFTGAATFIPAPDDTDYPIFKDWGLRNYTEDERAGLPSIVCSSQGVVVAKTGWTSIIMWDSTDNTPQAWARFDLMERGDDSGVADNITPTERTEFALAPVTPFTLDKDGYAFGLMYVTVQTINSTDYGAGCYLIVLDTANKRVIRDVFSDDSWANYHELNWGSPGSVANASEQSVMEMVAASTLTIAGGRLWFLTPGSFQDEWNDADEHAGSDNFGLLAMRILFDHDTGGAPT